MERGRKPIIDEKKIAEKMKVFLGDERYVLEAGDCLYFDSSMPHRGECVGDREPKVFVVIFSE